MELYIIMDRLSYVRSYIYTLLIRPAYHATHDVTISGSTDLKGLVLITHHFTQLMKTFDVVNHLYNCFSMFAVSVDLRTYICILVVFGMRMQA